MFKHFLTSLLFLTYYSYSQTETFTEKSVGSTGDFTNQPISLQSQYSHSQTIYYPNDMEFKGEITEIRFRSAFYQSKRENVGNWVVRIGYTNKEEFTPGDPFVNSQDLTEVFNGGYDIDGYDVIVRFTTPFNYDGEQNIIIDVQDTDDGFTTSLAAGFRGEENFNNPPTRSKMTFTKNGSTSGVYENSFANTRFIGNLERCPISFSINEDIIGDSEASFTIDNPNNINGFRYKIGLLNEDEPSSYLLTTSDFSINDLTSAKNYVLYYKSDCEEVLSSYKKLYFTTKPAKLTLPSSIDFETESHNYYPQNNFGGFISIAEEAGLNNSTKGLLLNGSSDSRVFNQWSNDSDTWSANSEFMSSLNFIIDLTSDSSNPVFEFSLKQFTNYQTVLRLKIDGQIQEFEYDDKDINDSSTRVISVDLADFKGKVFDLEIQHLARSNTRKSYIDDIKLKEATCFVPTNINLIATDDSVSINWESDATNWEIASTLHDAPFNNTGVTISTKSYTFANLEKAKPYNILIRSKCGDSNSPWLKLYHSTKPEVIGVPFEKNFRSTDALNDTDFSINHSRYSKVYQDFYKLLYLDQKVSRNTYGWVGGSSTTENEAWNNNKEFTSSVSFLVDATNLTDLKTELEFKQHYYYSPNTSWFRIKVNGNQIGQNYNPITVRRDDNTNVALDLTSYVGNIIEITLEQSGRNGPSNKNSINSAGDFTILRSINFTSETLSSEDYNLNIGTIYPNPTNDKLNISINKLVKETLVIDINGKVIFSKTTNPTSLDVSKLNKGMYFLQIISEDSSIINKKFIKF